MKHSKKALSGWLAVAAVAGGLLLAGRLPAQEASTNRDEIVHVLNRITFGPAPGDVEAVEQMGLHAYIEQQLHPEQIDDSAVEQKVAGFDLLQMSAPQLADLYEMERRTREAKRLAQQRAFAAENGNAGTAANPSTPMPAAGAAALNPDIQPQAPANLPMDPASVRARTEQNLKDNRSVTAIGQIQQAKLIRAVESKRQLQEVLVDFWGNHFNIDVKKGPDRLLKLVDDRDVIRPHIFGRFRDLLEASAKSPAMLFYLDNAQSSVARVVSDREAMFNERIRDRMVANGNGALAPPPAKVGDKRGGINENYAREVMELHTLGVDGGYTQQDVQEVARCFTGWSFDRKTYTFLFRAGAHDNGAKTVLGHFIPAGGGIQDGETVLDILASHPATAHHIALEMCQRFVSDDPPAPLVARIAKVFSDTGGDLRQVTAAILTSPEFLSPSDYNTKIKSPLEFTVSAVRATGGTISASQAPMFGRLVATLEGAGTLGREKAIDRANHRPRQTLNWHILELGEPLFACAPPTGYPEVSKSWVNPGALIERLNFALDLTEQKVSDVSFNADQLFNGVDADKPDAVLDRAIAVLLQDHISDTTRQVLQHTAVPADGESKTVDAPKLVALIIGSPEFQRK